MKHSSRNKRQTPRDWRAGISKISVFLAKKYSVPTPPITLVPGDKFPGSDKRFEKYAKVGARGIFEPGLKADGSFDPSILITLGNPSKTESPMRAASIFLHEYHHYLDWLKGDGDLPDQIPDLPYNLRGPSDVVDLSPRERWLWHKAQMDLDEFLATLKKAKPSKH